MSQYCEVHYLLRPAHVAGDVIIGVVHTADKVLALVQVGITGAGQIEVVAAIIVSAASVPAN